MVKISPMRLNDVIRALQCILIEQRIKQHYIDRTGIVPEGHLTQEQINTELNTYGPIKMYTDRDLTDSITDIVNNLSGFDSIINLSNVLNAADFTIKDILIRTERTKYKEIMRSNRTLKFRVLEVESMFRPYDGRWEIESDEELNIISADFYKEEQEKRGAKGGPIHQTVISKVVEKRMKVEYNAAFIGQRIKTFQPNWDVIDSIILSDEYLCEFWRQTTEYICQQYNININDLNNKKNMENVLEILELQEKQQILNQKQKIFFITPK